jgi:hypothetical protein
MVYAINVDGRRTQIGLLFLDPQLPPCDNACCVSFRLHLISFYPCRHFSSVYVHAHKQTLLSLRDLLTRARHEQNGYPQYCDGHWREDFYLAEELYIVDPRKMQLFMKKMNIKRLSTADKKKCLKDLANRLENQGFIARPAQVLSCFPLFFFGCSWPFILCMALDCRANPHGKLIQYKHVFYV